MSVCLRLAHVAHGFPTTGRPQAHTQFSVCVVKEQHMECALHSAILNSPRQLMWNLFLQAVASLIYT